MLRFRFDVIWVGLLVIVSIGALRPPARLNVDSPKTGEILQGVIPVTGSTVVTGFRSYEVSFTYDRDDSQTWFLIQQGGETIQGGTLAVWDTTTITDGDYRLRVQVFLENGQTEEITISGLKVRNYSAIEAPAVSPTQATAMVITGTPAAAPTLLPTPTPLPENPASITSGRLVTSLLWGLVLVLALFLLIGVYLGIRSARRKRK